MRIALLTYRGNMFCGGQGIYAAYLAREWKRAGHDVHVFAGPPLPELEEGIPLHVIDNDNFFARDLRDAINPARPFSALRPLSLLSHPRVLNNRIRWYSKRSAWLWRTDRP